MDQDFTDIQYFWNLYFQTNEAHFTKACSVAVFVDQINLFVWFETARTLHHPRYTQ